MILNYHYQFWYQMSEVHFYQIILITFIIFVLTSLSLGQQYIWLDMKSICMIISITCHLDRENVQIKIIWVLNAISIYLLIFINCICNTNKLHFSKRNSNDPSFKLFKEMESDLRTAERDTMMTLRLFCNQ